jgi:hypothetical protein
MFPVLQSSGVRSSLTGGEAIHGMFVDKIKYKIYVHTGKDEAMTRSGSACALDMPVL